MIRVLALFALLVLSTGAHAQCRLALILALDISSSVSPVERLFQVEGVATALEHRDVKEALLMIPGQPVALMVFEWSGQWNQNPVLPWTLINSEGDIKNITAQLRASKRISNNHPTAIGNALIYAREQFSSAPICAQQKIDVSGDGRNNDGVYPRRVYELFDWGDITVNGLAIESDEKDLTNYYRGAVIFGEHSFAMTATDFEGFADTMRRKLLRELEVMQLAVVE